MDAFHQTKDNVMFILLCKLTLVASGPEAFPGPVPRWCSPVVVPHAAQTHATLSVSLLLPNWSNCEISCRFSCRGKLSCFPPKVPVCFSSTPQARSVSFSNVESFSRTDGRFLLPDEKGIFSTWRRSHVQDVDLLVAFLFSLEQHVCMYFC